MRRASRCSHAQSRGASTDCILQVLAGAEPWNAKGWMDVPMIWTAQNSTFLPSKYSTFLPEYCFVCVLDYGAYDRNELDTDHVYNYIIHIYFRRL